MKSREPILLPEHDFPTHDWQLTERRFNTKLLKRTETLFAVANGYLGLRGNPEEGRPVHDHGTFVNGFHEQWDIVHAEEAYGLAKTGQTMIDVPDAKIIKLYVDDEPLYLPTAYLEQYERSLDMRRGTLTRDLVWETPSGKRVRVRSQRFVSTRHRHLAAFRYEVTVLNADAPVVISSQLLNRGDARAPDDPVRNQFDPRTTRTFSHRLLESKAIRQEAARVVFGYRTANSGMTLGCGMDHVVETECVVHRDRDVSADLGKVIYTVEARQGVPVRIDKFAAYHTSRAVPASELADRAGRTLDRATKVGYDKLLEDQEADVSEFWHAADVVVEHAPRVQQAIRWNLFQLMQASLRAEGTGIPAKGVTGHGYEGHYFWDVEIFVMPFLSYTAPRIAKNLLRFRHSMLNAARDRAHELGHDGALFPWRTITGAEASAYYQAGTAQYHLNADIMFALRQYVRVTGDESVLSEGGAEMLVETSRLWEDLGFHSDDDAFHLHSVTGPDEYTTVVNDNTFTNVMAAANLGFAVDVLRKMRGTDPSRYQVLCEDLGLAPDEIADWRAAADRMYVPHDDKRGVHPQDEHFLEREVWDFAATPSDNYPLLLHYHPLVIYRFQVIKQADVVLAMFLLGDRFSREQKRRNYRYYDPLTTSDSSLSPPVHAIVAAEIGDLDSAMGHFRLALFMDLADAAGNTDHGVHVASTGGVWMSLVNGFGGLRDYDGNISFDPALPKQWSRLAFPLTVRGQRLEVDLAHGQATFTLDGAADEALPITVEGKPVELFPGRPVEVALAAHTADAAG